VSPTKTEEILRQLALEDGSVAQMLLAVQPEFDDGSHVRSKTRAIARLGALIALDATAVSYQTTIFEALMAEVSAEEIVGALIAVAPLVGLARVTSAAPSIALALGYDVSDEIERFGGGGTKE
jgi:4-carboxymuconolactone decarboxylase